MVKEEEKTTDEDGDLLSYETCQQINIVNFVFINTFICCFGLASNVINIIIFCKQGFNFSININLLALSISDLCCNLSGLWCNITMNPLLRHADIPFVSFDVYYLSAGVPTVVFSRISGWITVFITAERCVGIVCPLKVKEIITPKRTTLVVLTIYMTNMLAISTEYINYRLDWKFYPDKNKTLYGLLMNDSFEGFDILTYVINSCVGFSSYIAVSVFTAILAFKLAQKSAWRQKATVANVQSNSMSDRDKKTIKMVVLIASVTIASYTPGAVVAMVMSFYKELRIMGLYRETITTLWSFPLIFQGVNSSVNIFFYYRMSTKYRDTFREMFAFCFKKLQD